MLINVTVDETQRITNEKFLNPQDFNFTLHWTDFEDTYFIVNLLRNRNKILELGTHYGYTCENILRYTDAEVITVDICKEYCPDLKYQKHELLPKVESGSVIQNRSNLTKVISYSHTYLEGCATGYFDAIFIDADHSYEAVKRDSELAFQKIAQGGIIVWHDVYNLDDIPDRKRNAEPENPDVVNYLKEIEQKVYKIERSWVAFTICNTTN